MKTRKPVQQKAAPIVLKYQDQEFFAILQREMRRQQDTLSMIPSENFFSPAVRAAVGSVFSHKYSEGNIGARYYEGCEHIDELEELAIERARKAFGLPDDWAVNVQALSGSNANLAVYLALLDPGDMIMSMYLPDGGHLSHGWSYEPTKQDKPDTLVYRGGSRKVNISSKLFRVVQYKTDPKTQLLDYDTIHAIAKKYKPKLIITGGTAYPRLIDHEKIRVAADAVGAYYLADIAHEAGLIAAGIIPTPVGIADVVTMTTHKTLRSGRGAIILAKESLMKKINRAVLPGLQGGPHNHNIAGICVGLGEALTPEFHAYAEQIVTSAKYLAAELIRHGFTLVTDGTDKHLILINLSNKPLLGKKFAHALDRAGIITNFNTMPQETRSPADPSALRLGTPWITTRGMKEQEMNRIAKWIKEVMGIASKFADQDFPEFARSAEASEELKHIARDVREMCTRFPLEF